MTPPQSVARLPKSVRRGDPGDLPTGPRFGGRSWAQGVFKPEDLVRWSFPGRESARLCGFGTVALACLLICVSVVGCRNGAWDWSAWFPDQASKKTPEDSASSLAESACYRDTVAEQAYFDGLRRLRVRGYGLVAGLGRNGSKQCPAHIRQLLIEEMYKTHRFSEKRDPNLSPEKIIDDPDTAVVTVEGEIPAVAPAGSRFDVIVRAVPGTNTVSLDGGWLYTCNLTLFQPAGDSAWIPGRVVGTAAGPVFLNPFAKGPDSDKKATRLEGVVLGGGVSQDDRRVRLLLTNPSYPQAINIAQRLNDRFATATQQVADAVSPAEIKITLPSAYRDDPKHFIALAQHVYLSNDSAFLAQKMQALGEEFNKPDASHADLALAWEAIGRAALAQAQQLYADPQPDRSFHAAAAGLRLGDESAVEVLEQHLVKPDGAHRLAAIGVLGAVGSPHAARPLRRALNDTDPRVRTAAFEALRRRSDPTITSYEMPESGFAIDVIDSTTENLIYAKRSDDPRIVLFGRNLALRPPLFFSLPDDTLMLDAPGGAEKVRLIRKSHSAGAASPPILAELNLPRFLKILGSDPPKRLGEPVSGLGVDYSSIVLLLSELCKADAIDAKFLLETPGPTVLPGSPQAERPESEQ